jgi:hypothetical protein
LNELSGPNYPIGIRLFMPGDLSDHGSVRPWINTVVRDCFHREIITENNAYGVVFDSLRAAYLFPGLVLRMKGDTQSLASRSFF